MRTWIKRTGGELERNSS